MRSDFLQPDDDGSPVLSTAGLAARIKAVGKPAVVTNFIGGVDAHLNAGEQGEQGVHVVPYLLVPLHNSSRTMAVLAVMDPSALEARSPATAALFLPPRMGVVSALASLAKLPAATKPSVVVVSVGSWPVTAAEIRLHGGSKDAAVLAAVQELGVEVRGIDVILLHNSDLTAVASSIGR